MERANLKMSANSFGTKLILHSFGESHGVALGAVIEGCPAGLDFDFKLLQKELSRRRPGSEAWVTQRNESDEPEVLSGVFEGKTLGTPIAIIVRNKDAQSQDYENIKSTPRAGHADDMWKAKFHHSDHRGGGRSSGRETLCRVIGGAVARMLLKKMYPQLNILGFATQIGPFELSAKDLQSLPENQETLDQFVARFPSVQHEEVKNLLVKAREEEGQSFGGVAEVRVKNMPQGLGQPVFHKLKSDLAQALMSVGAVTGFEIGEGFAATKALGTDFHKQNKNQYGGIRGGISTGEDLILKVAFKPTSSLLDVAKKGRHDPCIVPRAIPVLEAMVALVLADHALWAKTDRI